MPSTCKKQQWISNYEILMKEFQFHCFFQQFSMKKRDKWKNKMEFHNLMDKKSLARTTEILIKIPVSIPDPFYSRQCEDGQLFMTDH
jgi:hypothetical protein